MKLPPLWKIKREMHTARDQLRGMILQMTAAYWRSRYKKKELLNLKMYDGERPLSADLVLYLIYQPNKIPVSVLVSLEYIIAQGYEVLLVSNAPLSNDTLTKLRALCWKIIERPNIGYDFGGYLCGLNFLRNSNVIPNNLTLVNDSIWFPVISSTNILTETKKVVSDFGGAVGLADKSHRDQELVLSYWITVSGRLFQDDSFWKFWDNYTPTSNKSLTVKLGERGLSRAMHSEGLAFNTLYNMEIFISTLRISSFENLKLTLKYGAFTDIEFQKECNDLQRTANNSEAWRRLCLEFVTRVAVKRNFLHSFPYAAIALLHVPFVKKSNLRLHVLMREKYLLAVQAGDLQAPDSKILEEIRLSI